MWWPSFWTFLHPQNASYSASPESFPVMSLVGKFSSLSLPESCASWRTYPNNDAARRQISTGWTLSFKVRPSSLVSACFLKRLPGFLYYLAGNLCKILNLSPYVALSFPNLFLQCLPSLLLWTLPPAISSQ